MSGWRGFIASGTWHLFAWAAVLLGIYLSLAVFQHWWPIVVTLGPVLAFDAAHMVWRARVSNSRGFRIPIQGASPVRSENDNAT